MKKFNVLYWVHLSNTFEVEANTQEEAEEKLVKMIEEGEITLDDLDIGDDGVECQD